MHIYAFGSICRGEISLESDIDLIGITDRIDERKDSNVYSLYSYERIKEIWQVGNPFAWHLALEAKMLFSTDGSDLFKLLGAPSPYIDGLRDCTSFRGIFAAAAESIASNGNTTILDLASVFLAIRNVATFYSLAFVTSSPIFSRDAAINIGSKSLRIPHDKYEVFKKARMLNTRGHGKNLTRNEILSAMSALDEIEQWIDDIIMEFKK